MGIEIRSPKLLPLDRSTLLSEGSRIFHKWGPTDCLRGGLLRSRVSDSLCSQLIFYQKKGACSHVTCRISHPYQS